LYFVYIKEDQFYFRLRQGFYFDCRIFGQNIIPYRLAKRGAGSFFIDTRRM
jgi:hypothetical protein